MDAMQTTSEPAASEVASAAALECAFARHEREILGTLQHLVGNAEDARDAYQETFIKCWRHRQEVGGIENLRAWIFRVAVNTARDLKGAAWRRRRQPLADHDAIPDAQPAAHDQLQQQESLAAVHAAVAELRVEEREVFLLRQNGDLTYEEIARITGQPVGTIKTRMRLALSRLRGTLQVEEQGVSGE